MVKLDIWFGHKRGTQKKNRKEFKESVVRSPARRSRLPYLVDKTARINRLPLEILCEIFSFAAKAHNNFPAVAVLVCRLWRSTALNDRGLWSHIWLDRHSPLQKVVTWFRRIGSVQHDYYVTIVLSTVSRGSLPVDASEWSAALTLLRARRTRLSSFHFDGDVGAFVWLNVVFGPVVCREVQIHLEDPKVFVRGAWIPVHFPPPYNCDPVWPSLIPNDRDVVAPPCILSLRRTGLITSNIAVDNLVVLELLGLPRRRLPIPLPLLHLLGHMVHLQVLAIEYLHDDIEPPYQPSQIPSPICHARRLQLAGPWPILSFVSSVCFPSLERLVLDQVSDNLSAILEWMAAPLPPLEKLSLSRSMLSDDLIVECLDRFPALKHLQAFTQSQSVSLSNIQEILSDNALTQYPALQSLRIVTADGPSHFMTLTSDHQTPCRVEAIENDADFDPSIRCLEMIDAFMMRETSPRCHRTLRGHIDRISQDNSSRSPKAKKSKRLRVFNGLGRLFRRTSDSA
ncbi:hypothetical protein SISSUDRAFT_1128074 [Sistotremastrum suecicum HHB10207 ss-3]|uniref:F-box domain-containing protein n=1 Tax=Sistotremastrum suecicum HHB10207 ss-3 TaxID=1314776 RepID=A0A166E9Q8_9AGAM|nr:hypothetical protein SISSUDRAFT_1128074 [Sistotremastrum suecicum HHB10207 ss-3]